jgi:hypothetical protein
LKHVANLFRIPSGEGLTLAELSSEDKKFYTAEYGEFLLTLLAGNITLLHIYLFIPLIFNETNTIVSIIYFFSDSSSHRQPSSKYVVLFV